MSVPARPSRAFLANDILTSRVVLDAYPFRYVVILPATSQSRLVGTVGAPAEERSMIDEVLTAVEFLESRGWELVGLDQGFVACMRRLR